MRMKFLLAMALGLIAVTVIANAEIVKVYINDVVVIPEQPTIDSNITFEVNGGFPQRGPRFDESLFVQNDFSLSLDLFFTDGTGTTVPGVWSHSEEIGVLLPEIYDLTVQTYLRTSSESDYILNDAFPLQFEVIPEPATALLFGLGVFFTRRKKT